MNSCPLSDGYIRLNILQVATRFPQYWEIIHGTRRGDLYQGTFFFQIRVLCLQYANDELGREA